MVEEYKFLAAQDFPLFRKNPILKDRFFSPVPQLVIQKGNFQFLSACKGLAIGNASDDFIKILVVKRFTGRLAYNRASLDFIRLSLYWIGSAGKLKQRARVILSVSAAAEA
jgi:hypothetical protein